MLIKSQILGIEECHYTVQLPHNVRQNSVTIAARPITQLEYSFKRNILCSSVLFLIYKIQVEIHSTTVLGQVVSKFDDH